MTAPMVEADAPTMQEDVPTTDPVTTDAPASADDSGGIIWDDDDDEDEAPEASEPDAAEPDLSVTPEEPAPAAVEPPAAPEPDRFAPVEIEDIKGVYAIPGVHFDLKDRVIKMENEHAVKRMRSLLTMGVRYESTYRQQLQHHEAALKNEVAKAQADAQQFLDTLFQQCEQSDDDFIASMLAFKNNAPTIRYQMEIAKRDQEIANLRGRPQPNTASAAYGDAPEERVQEWREGHTRDLLAKVKQSGAEPWLDEAAMQDLHRTALSEAGLAYFARRATEQDVQANPTLAVGQPIIDEKRFFAYLEPLARTYRTAHEKIQAATTGARTTVQQLQKPAKVNQAIIAEANRTVPAVKKPTMPPAPAREPTFEEERERARNELGQFIRSTWR